MHERASRARIALNPVLIIFALGQDLFRSS